MEESDTTVYDTLRREIKEELGIAIAIIGVENQLEQKGVRAYPLPVSMHTVRYEHKTRGMIEKFEYIFFARAEGKIMEGEEVEMTKRMDMEEILALDDDEIPPFIKQILDQNSDLLEVIG